MDTAKRKINEDNQPRKRKEPAEIEGPSDDTQSGCSGVVNRDANSDTKQEENFCDIEKTPHLTALPDTSERTINGDNQSSEHKDSNEHERTSDDITTESGCSEVENRADYQVTDVKSLPSTKHNNWYTSTLALKYLQPAFVPIVQDKISNVRDATVSKFGRKLCDKATVEDITKSHGNMAKFKHKCDTRQNDTYACQTLINIIKNHTSDSVHFYKMLQGTDPQKWTKTPLDFVRLFLKNWMRCGIEDFKDCDISALCDIVTRCKPLMQMFDKEQIAAVRRVRNTTMHCAQLELSKQDMEDHIEIILDFLNHIKSLKNTDDVTKAIDCINQLKTGDVRFLHKLMVELITGVLPGARQEYLHKNDKANKLHQNILNMEKELDRLSSGVETAEPIHKGSEAVLQAKEDRPGQPKLKRVLVDSVDIEWDGVHNFRDGDAYQVNIKNIQTRTFDSKYFKVNSGNIGGLQPGTSYVFKVRLVKDSGEESDYSENSDEVTTKKEPQQEANIPGKPSVIRVFSDSVDIVWDGVRNFSEEDAYQVHIENTQTGQWDSRIFEKNRGKIGDLQPGATYVLKARLVKANGEVSKYSENSEEFKTKNETKQKTDRPGKPYVKEIYTDSVDIVWDSVQNFQKGDRYQVRLVTVPEGKWELQHYEITNVKITGLMPNTSYLFKVRWVKSNGAESTYSEESDIITTTMSFASKILGVSKLLINCSRDLDIYQLPLNELLNARNECANSKKFEIGPRDMNVINEKTILLVGATGSGKSTFVDLLANYVLGVRLDDPFRFTVMKEAESRTGVISCYSFNKQAGTRLKFRINVIDTPGFGAEVRQERDVKTFQQIRQLFDATGTKGIETIDAVCFLLKATESQLAHRISEVMVSMFSQDIRKTICAITTFADGSEPKVIAALEAEKITFDNIFYFNNSALFSDPMKNSLTSMFWKMGFQSLDELFNHINKLKPNICSLGEAST